ncbi:MAG: hypothetical protein UW75_C0048G0005 [Parcubacteria group bacterium GW2011_GWF2_44_8]|nr:MAG: hypothetical protein UW75_C0048G0005 [Parcubacteria group bacterium GW2011_GWF2_44_8]
MKKYVALLRGINVGGNNKVAMPKLKECFESLGYRNVITYINSGNIIFETKKVDQKKITKEIEAIIKTAFNLDIRVLLRDSVNIKKVCSLISSEWTNDKEQRCDVLFLWDEFANKKSVDLIEINPAVDTLKYIEGAVVWHFDKKYYTKSKMHKFIGTTIYKHMTARNINTVRKIASLMEQN